MGNCFCIRDCYSAFDNSCAHVPSAGATNGSPSPYDKKDTRASSEVERIGTAGANDGRLAAGTGETGGASPRDIQQHHEHDIGLPGQVVPDNNTARPHRRRRAARKNPEATEARGRRSIGSATDDTDADADGGYDGEEDDDEDEEARAYWEAKEQQLQQQQEQLQQQQEQLLEKEELLQRKEQQLRQKEEQLLSLLEEKTNLQGQLSAMAAAEAALRKAGNGAVAQLQEKLAAAEKQLAEEVAVRKANSTAVANLQERLAAAEVRLTEETTVRKASDAAAADLKAKLTAALAQLTDATTVKDASVLATGKLQTKYSAVEVELVEESTARKAGDAAIVQLKERLLAAKVQLTEESAERKASDSAIAKMQDRLASAIVQVTDEIIARKKSDALMAGLEKDKAELEAQVKALQAKGVTAAAENKALQVKVAALEVDLQRAQASAAEHQSRLEELRKEMETLEVSARIVHGQHELAQAQVQILEQQKADLSRPTSRPLPAEVAVSAFSTKGVMTFHNGTIRIRCQCGHCRREEPYGPKPWAEHALEVEIASYTAAGKSLDKLLKQPLYWHRTIKVDSMPAYGVRIVDDGVKKDFIGRLLNYYGYDWKGEGIESVFGP
ncbi:hypothetical protein Agub_g7548 [Astrephomene gubernaculifera]|uniref:Uncharacterized protein n=1 Tax=Astrephomene gubernaculifera TaxID=47775 RepID=A0AAD3DQ97_9CHLO|nr:hypothetical protein Agub_g7548 [Astrephomene gubernaculifera]